MRIRIAAASDHAGFALKTWLIENFAGADIVWTDLGTDSGTSSVDYPDFGHKLAEVLARGEADFGLAVCGTGIGISMALNRHEAVRAALCTSAEMAHLARAHNDANVLCLGARIVSQDVARDCLKAFLETEFEGGRHVRRVEKLGKES